jgi:glycosyltransferase involved in cell wall biosynthesis
MAKLSVVIATYNGEKYIVEQLKSIVSQTRRPDEIVLVDDASKDNVFSLARDFLIEANIPFVAHKNLNNLGYMKTFESALKMATGDYIAFSDQDDVWQKNKLEKLFSSMKKLESMYGLNVPFITFSDVAIVDSCLNVISNSFDKTQKLYIEKTSQSFRKLCVQNVVTGMSMMINRTLKELVLPFPDNAIHHDWWIALVCAKQGKIEYIKEPLAYYRQHDTNTLGAKLYDDVVWFYRIRTNINKPKEVKKYIRDMKYELYENYRCHVIKHSKQKLELIKLFPNDKVFLSKVAYHLQRGGITSVIWLTVHNVLPPSWQRKIFFCLSMLKRHNVERKRSHGQK